MRLTCIQCGARFEPDPWLFRCSYCYGLLDVTLPEDMRLDWRVFSNEGKGVWRYRRLLPVKNWVEPVSLGEGGTPLIRVCNVASERVYLKFEGANPTGSFKDRGMTVGVTIAKYSEASAVAVASTGNTAASAAAYAARAGLKCMVYLPKGGVAKGKIAQALLHGAIVVEVEGSFDKALDEVLERVISRDSKIYPLNSINPWRLEGQKTIAYEIVEDLKRVPDVVVVPVGNAGNISAIWKGFRELWRYGLVDKMPRMIGVQAEGAAPLARAWSLGIPRLDPVDEPKTIASAIRIGRPVNWLKAWRAVEESKGAIIAVSDHEIKDAQRLLARREGIGVEPASAATLAGYYRAVREKLVDRDEEVVLIATGHALKDPDSILSP